MEEAQRNSISAGSAQEAKPVTVCAPRLVQGMSDQEAQDFDGSYKRSKKVLMKINEIAREEYLRILKDEENPQALNLPDYGAYCARKMGERYVWKKLQELTRTK